MPIIVNDNGDISFFANIKDAELYLEPDDIKQNFYEIFNRNGDLLKPIILKNSKKFLFGNFIKENIQITPHIPNIMIENIYSNYYLIFVIILNLKFQRKLI